MIINVILKHHRETGGKPRKRSLICAGTEGDLTSEKDLVVFDCDGGDDDNLDGLFNALDEGNN